MKCRTGSGAWISGTAMRPCCNTASYNITTFLIVQFEIPDQAGHDKKLGDSDHYVRASGMELEKPCSGSVAGGFKVS